VLFGQSVGWKMPKFSALVGSSVGERDDWCEDHGVPESQCVECRPDLLPPGKDYGWCQEHGVHNCPLEHADVAQVKKLPEVAEADRQRAARALASALRPENNAVCKNYRRRIQFASLDAVKKAGVEVARDRSRSASRSRPTAITYDQTRFATLVAPARNGMAVEKNVGDRCGRKRLPWIDAERG
jgi:hypothetical protein